MHDPDPENPYPDGVGIGYYLGHDNVWDDVEELTSYGSGWEVTAWAEMPDVYRPEK